MIERYADHAANERTFLAWVRTGIATIAFGFVVEKFNLFVLTLAEANAVIHNDLAQTLKALEETARSIRALANMLERRPEALIRGKN